MAAMWLNAMSKCLTSRLPSLVVSMVLLGATAATSVVPSPSSQSGFLGTEIDGNGLFSLEFSGTDGTRMSNTLFSDHPGLVHRDARLAEGDKPVLSITHQRRGRLATRDGGHVEWEHSAPGVLTIRAGFSSAAAARHGTTFTFSGAPYFYGVWEYPWGGAITNNHYGANLTAATVKARRTGQPMRDIGLYGPRPGINWCNARAPFFFTDSGLGVYIDTDRPVSFTFREGVEGRANVTLMLSGDDDDDYDDDGTIPNLSYQILYEHADTKSLLRQFSQLSSYPLMPTEAGYGPIFWSDDFEQDFHDSSIRNAQDNINDVADHLDKFQIRATSFFADRPYGTGNSSFGNFDFDPRFYPSPAEFIASLRERGYDFQAWVANRAFLNTQLYNASAQHHWLYPGIDPVQFQGPALNLSIPAAYAYYREQLMDFVASMGIRGFKIDRGSEYEMPDSEQNKEQNLFLMLCDEVMLRVWGHDSRQGASNSSRRTGGYYNFARSAFDRDRSRVGIWNGDSEATFEGLRYTVASGIRAGLLGFSHWGSDTGGYLRDAGGPTEELFARWMHVSAWTPMYEIMVGLGHTPWYQYSPRLVGVLAQTAAQHTRLVPYLRSYAAEASRTGIPVLRALFLEFPADRAAYTTADAYMLGRDFLVAPVLAAGGNRTVRFPQGGGSKFLEYENKTAVYAPGTTHEIMNLRLESTPVYVREGALVATGDIFAGNARGWRTAVGADGRKVSAWTPHLVFEAFPSFNVPKTMFFYYRGREADVASSGRRLLPGTVAITMTTHRADRTVTLHAAGDVGVPAKVVLYQKAGKKGETRAVTLEWPAANQTVVARDVYSLFE